MQGMAHLLPWLIEKVWSVCPFRWYKYTMHDAVLQWFSVTMLRYYYYDSGTKLKWVSENKNKKYGGRAQNRGLWAESSRVKIVYTSNPFITTQPFTFLVIQAILSLEGVSPKMLRKMIHNSPTFAEYNREKQEIISALADAFEEDKDAVYLAPIQLVKSLGLGNPELWQEFLNLEQTRSYIKAQMGFNAQIASRKAFAALQHQASTGDVQAAKQINELAGILQNADQNRIIVLHKIDRKKD